MIIEGDWPRDEIQSATALFPETRFVQTAFDPQSGTPYQIGYGPVRPAE